MVKEGFPSPYGDCEHFRITDVAAGETQHPFQGAVDIYHGFTVLAQCYGEIFANSSRYSQQSNVLLQLGTKFVDDMAFAFRLLEAWEIYTVFTLAALWIVARYFFFNYMFRPAAKWAGVHENNLQKFCEAAWICSAYFLMWLMAVDIVFYHGYDFFAKPSQMYRNWAPSRPPNDLSILYAVEFSFYLHGLYVTLFVNAWSKKNSPIMLIHHIFASALILFSFAARVVPVGVLIFVLNDITDVFLEGSKVAHYLSQRKSGFSRFFSLLEKVLSLLLAFTWVYNRLWSHLTKVWLGASFGSWVSLPVLPVPFQLFLNIFVVALYLLQVYWATILIPYVVRSVIFGSKKRRPPAETKSGETKKSD